VDEKGQVEMLDTTEQLRRDVCYNWTETGLDVDYDLTEDRRDVGYD
jgi:hypothetical protein